MRLTTKGVQCIRLGPNPGSTGHHAVGSCATCWKCTN